MTRKQERMIQTLKRAIREGIDTLRHDLHATKAVNTLDILDDVLDLCGWPDEDGPDG